LIYISSYFVSVCVQDGAAVDITVVDNGENKEEHIVRYSSHHGMRLINKFCSIHELHIVAISWQAKCKNPVRRVAMLLTVKDFHYQASNESETILLFIVILSSPACFCHI
jgi:hypothetical protein